MDTPLVITLPKRDEALKSEVEALLKPHGEVSESGLETFGLEELKLLFETLTAGGTTVGTFATIIYMLKDRIAKDKQNKIKIGPPGEDGVPLDEVDEQVIRRLEEWGK